MPNTATILIIIYCIVDDIVNMHSKHPTRIVNSTCSIDRNKLQAPDYSITD
jgi:hypothetical protein